MTVLASSCCLYLHNLCVSLLTLLMLFSGLNSYRLLHETKLKSQVLWIPPNWTSVVWVRIQVNRCDMCLILICISCNYPRQFALHCSNHYFPLKLIQWIDSFSRKRLFQMINDLPTIFEVVTGNAKQSKDHSGTNNNNSKSKPSGLKVSSVYLL